MYKVEIDYLLNMIKNDQIDKWLTEKIGESELKNMARFKIIDWIKNNIQIDLDKKKFKEALGDDNGEIVSVFAAAVFDKDEMKELINKSNEFEQEVYANLIIGSGEVDKYLKEKTIKALGLGPWDVVELIKATNDPENYLNPVKLNELGLNVNRNKDAIVELIKATTKPGDYPNPDKLKELGLNVNTNTIVNLIKATIKPGDHLDPNKLEKLGLNGNTEAIVNLIKATKDPEYYLNPVKLNELGLNKDKDTIVDLIKATKKTGDYLNPNKLNELGLNGNANAIVKLIKETENPEDYLNPDKLNKLRLEGKDVVGILLETKDPEKYLNKGKLEKLGLNNNTNIIVNLIEKTENPEDYLNSEKINEFKLKKTDVIRIMLDKVKPENYLNKEKLENLGLIDNKEFIVASIKKTGNPENYLNPVKLNELGLNKDKDIIVDLIIETEKPRDYLNQDKLNELGLKGNAKAIVKLIYETKDPKYYLNPDKLNELGLKGNTNAIVKLIYATKDPKYYLNPDKLEGLELNKDKDTIVELIKETKDPKYYLNPDKLEGLELNKDKDTIVELIKETKDPEYYLNPDKLNELGLNGNAKAIVELIKETKNPEDYLNSEKINELNLKKNDVIGILLKKVKPEKYLNKEKLENLGLIDNKEFIVASITNTDNPENYLNQEKLKELELNGNNVVKIMIKTGKLERNILFDDLKDGLVQLINESLNEELYSTEKILETYKISKNLDESNSEKLSRIKNEVALQICKLPKDDREKKVEIIKNMFLRNDIPTFAQNFLVFQQLHPSFMENSENVLYNDRSIENIPSLDGMNASQKSRIIFTDLLKINIESNNRDLQSYLNNIEKGNALFGEVIEKKIQINDELSEDKRHTLKKYSEILNSIYNQICNRHDLKNMRKNSGDLQQDLIKLSELYKIDKYGTETLPDRIVRTFAKTLGIKTISDAKEMIESIPRNVSERNKEWARNGQITLEEGDYLAKGVSNTEYLASMLQSGIVAKDYLGQSAHNDCTPCDMDCELITAEKGSDFKRTYSKIMTATRYTNIDASNRKLGKVVLIFKKNENFVKTRNGYNNVDKNAVKTVIRDKSKIEYFDNNGQGGTNAHGVRTGLGSTRIKCIISDRFVDKLGLEIALNGFYIPVVDEEGKVIFTPEMYDQIREKMQGLSHYGLTEFKLDESAKNDGTRQLIDFIEQSKEEVSHKREMIIQTLKKAIEEQGLTMSTERKLDLVSGIVEVIDTGSTGRGTNEPGDGDFDFMMRMDKRIIKEPEEFKEKIREVLSDIAKPEKNDETARGDFRYKGVSVNGLEKKVDLDLTFEKRTDEIEYTTEESIKDRLETIKRNNPEDYKYVVANILLAKRALKTEGVYKKKNAAQPEPRS